MKKSVTRLTIIIIIIIRLIDFTSSLFGSASVFTRHPQIVDQQYLSLSQNTCLSLLINTC